MRDHAALGWARGSRRVDERADVVGADRVVALLPIGVGARGAALGERVERDRVAGLAVHEDQVLELRALIADPANLLELLVVLDHHRDGVGVLEHVLALLRRVRLVDRDDRGAGRERGEVEVGPLGPRVREDRDLVALLDPQAHQPERELADDLADLGVGLRDPDARVILVDDGPLGAVLAHGGGEQVGERLGAGRRLGRGSLDRGRFHSVPLPQSSQLPGRKAPRSESYLRVEVAARTRLVALRGPCRSRACWR